MELDEFVKATQLATGLAADHVRSRAIWTRAHNGETERHASKRAASNEVATLRRLSSEAEKAFNNGECDANEAQEALRECRRLAAEAEPSPALQGLSDCLKRLEQAVHAQREHTLELSYMAAQACKVADGVMHSYPTNSLAPHGRPLLRTMMAFERAMCHMRVLLGMNEVREALVLSPPLVGAPTFDDTPQIGDAKPVTSGVLCGVPTCTFRIDNSHGEAHSAPIDNCQGLQKEDAYMACVQGQAIMRDIIRILLRTTCGKRHPLSGVPT